MVKHSHNSLTIFVLIILGLLVVFFGLPLFGYNVFSFDFSPKYSEQESLNKLVEIQQNQGALTAYPTNLASLETYIAAVLDLSGNSSGNALNVINIDVETATSFYHLLRAENESKTLTLGNCDKILLANSRAYADESILHSNKALNLLQEFNGNPLALRQNQSQMIEYYKQRASNLKILINDDCGTS